MRMPHAALRLLRPAVEPHGETSSTEAESSDTATRRPYTLRLANLRRESATMEHSHDPIFGRIAPNSTPIPGKRELIHPAQPPADEVRRPARSSAKGMMASERQSMIHSAIL